MWMEFLSCFGQAFLFLQVMGYLRGTVDIPRGLHHPVSPPPQITLHPIFQMHRQELATPPAVGGREAGRQPCPGSRCVSLWRCWGQRLGQYKIVVEALKYSGPSSNPGPLKQHKLSLLFCKVSPLIVLTSLGVVPAKVR